MKFLVDAQLPRRLAQLLAALGHDAIHTLDLAAQNRTTDSTILQIAADQDRVVVTKDGDFVDTFVVSREPAKLLLVSTGNISNQQLQTLFEKNMPDIKATLTCYNFVEISHDSLVAHA